MSQDLPASFQPRRRYPSPGKGPPTSGRINRSSYALDLRTDREPVEKPSCDVKSSRSFSHSQLRMNVLQSHEKLLAQSRETFN